MLIPFYQDEGYGLLWEEERLTWVTVRRTGATLRVVDVCRVPVRSGDTERALRMLVDRVEPSSPHVATHLEASHVRLFEARCGRHAPDDWAESEARRRLPGGASLTDFVVRAIPLLDDDERDGDPYVLAVARRQAVEGRREALAAAGLEAIAVSDLRLDLPLALAWDADTSESGQCAGLLMRSDRSWLVRSQFGLHTCLPEEWVPGVSDFLDVAGASTDDPAGRPAGDPADNRTEAPGPVIAGDGPADEEVTGDGVRRTMRLGPDGDAIDADLIPAVALAVRHLAPHAGDASFAPRSDADRAVDARDRAHFQTTVLALAAVILLGLLVTTGTSMMMQSRLQAAEMQGMQMQEQTAVVERARAQTRAVRDRLAASRDLVRRRTRTATVLDRVGASVPDGVWLTAVESNPRDGRTRPVRISGYARSGREVTRLLSGLEGQKAFHDVQLRLSRRQSAETIERAVGHDVGAQVAFDVQLQFVRTPR